MTVPDEEVRALLNTRLLLVDLLTPGKTPRVPRRVREQARHLLKHFPAETQRMQQLVGVLSRRWLDGARWDDFLAALDRPGTEEPRFRPPTRPE